LDAKAEDGSLCLGIKKTMKELLLKLEKRGELVLEEGIGKGEAADGLTHNMKTGSTFCSGGEDGQGGGEGSGIRGGEEWERRRTSGGGENLGFGEIEVDTVREAKLCKTFKEEWSITEWEDDRCVIKIRHGGRT
jgi:hypothetical protein